MGICPKMKGDKCAEQHCDLWCLVEKRCLEAVIREKGIEIADLMIDDLTETKKAVNLRIASINKKDITRH